MCIPEDLGLYFVVVHHLLSGDRYNGNHVLGEDVVIELRNSDAYDGLIGLTGSVGLEIELLGVLHLEGILEVCFREGSGGLGEVPVQNDHPPITPYDFL